MADDERQTRAAPPTGGAFTIPLLCAGIGLIACCVLIPQADENRRMVYECEKLRAELEQIQAQIEVNDEFLQRLSDDPAMAERLAQRQMKMIREGTGVLELKGRAEADDISPFRLVSLPPPPPLPPYRPIGGGLAELCRQPKSQLYLLGAGMMLVATGLVLGCNPRHG